MDKKIIDFLKGKGYKCDGNAMSYINTCNDWYTNKFIEDFHRRKSCNDAIYDMDRLGFAKRCCADDANLCEVVEINASKNDEMINYINNVFKKN